MQRIRRAEIEIGGGERRLRRKLGIVEIGGGRLRRRTRCSRSAGALCPRRRDPRCWRSCGTNVVVYVPTRPAEAIAPAPPTSRTAKGSRCRIARRQVREERGLRFADQRARLLVRGGCRGHVLVRDLNLSQKKRELAIAIDRPPFAAVEIVDGRGDLPALELLERLAGQAPARVCSRGQPRSRQALSEA